MRRRHINFDILLLTMLPQSPTKTPTAPSDSPLPQYDSILQDAMKWIREMEAIRDTIFELQISNAIALDHLVMAGVDDV